MDASDEVSSPAFGESDANPGNTETNVPHLRVEDAGELIAAIPAMLGFVPTRSLVMALLSTDATQEGDQSNTEAERITSHMQPIDQADLGLRVIRTSTSIPAWIPESILDHYTRAPLLAYRYCAVLHRLQCADRTAARQPRQRRINRQRIAAADQVCAR
ncbi:DUF4192 family protein [Nocardia fluminea]|uniref:DUF4192 family protein n=1 Tax=Nocardia fluminea TaxID=134984 RepID=UPI00341C8EB6